jgi:polar amino acid transport system substrate-binding protein
MVRQSRRGRFLVFISMLTVVIASFYQTSCTTQRQAIGIAYDPSWRPLYLQGLEPSLSGFCMDLMAEMANQSKTTIQAIRTAGQTLLYNLEAGDYEAVFTTMTPTPELRTVFEFSAPILQTGTSLVARVGNAPSSPTKLTGLIVGVQSNSTAFAVLTQIPGVSFKQYGSPLDALEDLSDGHLDAVAMERLPAINFCRHAFKGRLTVLEPPLDPQPGIRLATKKESPYFKKLADSLSASPISALLRRWGLGL